MYVPVMTTCGHNYCYDCISNWLVSNNANELTCPQCRQPLKDPPALNSALQHLLNIIIDLCAPGDARQDRTRAESVAQYKDDVDNNTLYKDVFNNTAMAVVDDDDGVARCSNCHWEVEGDVCPHCSARMRNRTADYDEEEDDDEQILSDESLERSNNLRYGSHRQTSGLLQDVEAESDYESEPESDIDNRPTFGGAREILNHINERDRRRQSDDDDDERDSDLDSFIVDEAEAEQSSDQSGGSPDANPRVVQLDGSDEDSHESHDSDFYEHNDDGGFASGDSLDISNNDNDKDNESGRKVRKRRFQVLDDSDEDE
ncbi:LANO_0F13432g1_1 [Lachancea nothofagi CBS 11611]|uniref:LANO_0F13432g1_1 n=1 Tax=Lachancea nothofagi CBS 11611 TaxID=1266666 RepID=A0A1G4KBW8_9SACH|nr:LANO_0F13432g1_1 [Lachancea nothofagi CBS 11611]